MSYCGKKVFILMNIRILGG